MRSLYSLQLSVFALAVLFAAMPVSAVTPPEILATFEQAARQSDPAFKGFSVQRGAQFFSVTHGNEWSCSSCHTQQPTANGKHAKTGKTIAPLAPSANAERFTDVAKVEKWFKRNCNDVLGRACTAQEKGDVLAYLMSVRP